MWTLKTYMKKRFAGSFSKLPSNHHVKCEASKFVVSQITIYLYWPCKSQEATVFQKVPGKLWFILQRFRSLWIKVFLKLGRRKFKDSASFYKRKNKSVQGYIKHICKKNDHSPNLDMTKVHIKFLIELHYHGILIQFSYSWDSTLLRNWLYCNIKCNLYY